VGLSDRQIRDAWMADGTATSSGVLANAWKETVRDAVVDVRAHREAAKVEVRCMIGRGLLSEAERKRLYTLLTRDQWTGDPPVRRWMRRQWRRGHNHISNQIIIRSDNVRTFTLTDGGDVWLAIPGLAPRTSVVVPPDTRVAPTGALRVILRGGRVEVHYQIDDTAVKSAHRRCGTATVVVDKATMVVAEDLSRTFTGCRKLGADTNRRLAAWTKGITAEALKNVSGRRGSAVRLVNAAYTSQVIPGTSFLGRRVGDRRYCPHGGRVVWHADHAAAINVLDRGADADIGLYTPYWRVKQIIQDRADRQRSRLPDQDSNTTGHYRCGERNIRSRSTLIKE
jgi:hypothetical protein